MNRTSSLRILTASTLALGLGVVGLATRASASPPRPPEEAFTACSGKSRGDACAVQIHNHTMEGVCDAPPNESRLACRPNGPPPEP